MAAKLTFEAKMAGMDQVLEMLKTAEGRMTDFGRVGSYAVEGVDKRMKEFSMSLETITKSQSGFKALFDSFDQFGKRSNEFLGKAYKGVLDGMRYEVKGFENQIDEVNRKMEDSFTRLEQFKARRDHMKAEDYNSGVSSMQAEANAHVAEKLVLERQKKDMEMQLKMASPAFGLSPEGAGRFITQGAAYAYGPGIVSAALGMPAMASQGAYVLGGAMVRQGYTKEADAFIAQQRLVLGAAQEAKQGQVTVNMLKSMGLGLENNVPGSAGYRIMENGQYYGQTAGVQGMAGAGVGLGVAATGIAGIGAASLMAEGGAAALMAAGGGGALATGLGLMGPLGWAALGVGAIGYGAYRYMQASKEEKSQAQIRAENMQGFRSRDKEAYGTIFDPAGSLWMNESQNLELNQRMFGMNATHNAVMGAAYNGVSPERAMKMHQMMAAQGLDPNQTPGINTFIKNTYGYGVSDRAQQQMIRSMGVGGGSIGGQMQGGIDLLAAAGLGGRDAFAARGGFFDAAADITATRGGGQGMDVAGTGLALAIGANSSGFNKVEGVQQGLSNYKVTENLLQGGSSGLDTIMVSKLRQLGVTDAVAIANFIKLGLTNPNTQQSIANYTKKSLKEVRAALLEGANSYEGMINTVVGKENMDRFNQATGRVGKDGKFHKGDMTTLMLNDVKSFENTTAGGAGVTSAMKAEFATEGTPAPVEASAETGSDVQAKGKAGETVSSDEQLQRLLQGTGKTVTDAITAAVVKGFTDTANAVKAAGDKLAASKPAGPAATAAPGAPFGGTKGK